MGVRENKVEKYLDGWFTRLGGLTRKWVSPGRDGVPDRICFLPAGAVNYRHLYEDFIFFVEVKTDDGELSQCQKREQHTLRDAGASVTTVYGNSGVDSFMNFVLHGEGDFLQSEYH